MSAKLISQNARSSKNAFTIVELLIVIVVIALLAAITIVAYNGIKNRTYDATVQSDLSSFAKHLKLIEADTGVPPAGGSMRSGGADIGNNTTFPGVLYQPSKEAYLAGINNFYYCTGVETATNQTSFRLLARSKSMATIEYKSNTGLRSLGIQSIDSSYCLSPYGNSGSWTYGQTNGAAWNSWTNH